MEKSDPAFVPEWLKNNGNGKHEGGSSSLHSDDAALSRSESKMSSLTINDHEVGRLSRSDQPTSAYFRRSYSSNSSRLRSYSSSDRIRGEKSMYQNRDNDKYPYSSFRRQDKSNPPDGILPSKFGKDKLRRSQSVTTGKQNETWLRKGALDSSNTSRSLHGNWGSIGWNGHNATVPRNVPSPDVKEIGGPKGEKIQLPGLSTAAVLGSQTNHESSGSGPSTISLNTGETLAQVTTAATATQSPAGRQRLEELAFIKSRQLIPVTPSMPKTLFPSHTEKTKIKIMQQQHHISSSTQHANSYARAGHSKSNAPRTSNVGKLLVLKPSREKSGEFRVVSPTEREDLSPIDQSRSRVNNSEGASSEHMPTTMEKKPTSQAQSRHDFFNLVRKKSSSNTQTPSLSDNLDNVITTSLAPVQDVLNKTITNDSVAAVPSHINEAPLPVYFVRESLVKAVDVIVRDECAGNESMDGNLNRDNDEKELAFLRSLGWEERVEEDDVITSFNPVPDASNEIITNVALAAVPSHINKAPLPVYSVGESSVKAVDDMVHNECVCKDSKDGNLNRDYDEKELAFLRSLGWKEPVEEDECLTEEEINAFFELYMKLQPMEALKFQQRSRCSSK